MCGKKHKLCGSRFYTNGVVNKRFYDGDIIPDGWVPGMHKRSEETNKIANERRKKTTLEKYGVENVFQSEEIKNKSKETNFRNYGVEYYSQSEESKGKFRELSLKRYGVENPFQSEEVKEKIRSTNLERYGTEYPTQSEMVRIKTKRTNLERYGVESPLESEEIREKIKQTMLERYGVEHPLQSKDILDLMKVNNMRKYGVEYPSQLEDVKEKARNTFIHNLGVEYPSKSDDVKNKRIKSYINRYGTENPAQSEEIKQKIQHTNEERYGVPWACMRPEARFGYSNDSVPNMQFEKLLKFGGIKYEREFHLEHYSYDFKIGNTLIEINPFATHNTLWSPFNSSHGVSKDYHLNKSLTAEKHNFHCIHIFDWTNVQEILNKITSRDYRSFVQVQKIKEDEYMLKLNVVSFEYDKEIKEFLDDFVNKNNPKSIISYCDFSKYRRGIYDKLGFKLIKEITPRCHWYNPKTHDHLIEENLSGKEYVPIYDCGIYTYILESE